MKCITLIIVLLVMGCGKTENATVTEPKPLSPEEQKLVGGYGANMRGEGLDVHSRVLLKNGVIEKRIGYGKLGQGMWSILNQEIHATYVETNIVVYSFSDDGVSANITRIARIVDGKRKDIPEDQQTRYDKKSSFSVRRKKSSSTTNIPSSTLPHDNPMK